MSSLKIEEPLGWDDYLRLHQTSLVGKRNRFKMLPCAPVSLAPDSSSKQWCPGSWDCMVVDVFRPQLEAEEAPPRLLWAAERAKLSGGCFSIAADDGSDRSSLLCTALTAHLVCGRDSKGSSAQREDRAIVF